nr:uncharacterized protein LOC118879375 [Drosophila suzukii]XP_036678329.1 uncharacterized protein LOC118879557 [Drosophila suzukii]
MSWRKSDWMNKNYLEATEKTDLSPKERKRARRTALDRWKAPIAKSPAEKNRNKKPVRLPAPVPPEPRGPGQQQRKLQVWGASQNPYAVDGASACQLRRQPADAVEGLKKSGLK